MEVKFGTRVRELRVAKNLKQSDVAKAMNVKPPTITRWETGENEPDFRTLVMLAEFFGESVGYLLGVED